MSEAKELPRMQQRYLSEIKQKLQEEFGLHELAVEDARKGHQRPKIEEYGDSLFVVLRTVEADGERGAGAVLAVGLAESYGHRCRLLGGPGRGTVTLATTSTDTPANSLEEQPPLFSTSAPPFIRAQ